MSMVLRTKKSVFVGSLKGMILILASGCFQGPGLMKQSGSAVLTDKTGASAGTVVQAEVVSSDNSAVTAKVSASSGLTQEVAAPEQSAIAGASLSVPPGTVAVDTAITVEEAVSLTSDADLNELGLNEGDTAAPAVAVLSSEDISAVSPMTLALPLPDGSSGLRLQDSGTLVVAYKIKIPASAGGGYKAGLLPPGTFTISEGKALVQITNFGVYQMVRTEKKIEAPVEVAVTAAPVTKREQEVAPPPGPFKIKIAGYKPDKKETGVAWEASQGAAVYKIVIALTGDCRQEVARKSTGELFVIFLDLPPGKYFACVYASTPAHQVAANNQGFAFEVSGGGTGGSGSGSGSDGTIQPPPPMVHTWDFSDPSKFTVTGDFVISGGMARSVARLHRDNTGVPAEFGSGQSNGVTVDGQGLAMTDDWDGRHLNNPLLVRQDGFKVYYRFNEASYTGASNSVSDALGGANATISGLSVGNIATAGVIDGAPYLPATSQILSPADAFNFLTNEPFTVMFWLNIPPPGSPKLVFNSYTGDQGIKIGVNSIGQVTAQFFAEGQNGASITSTQPVADYRWHHIVLTYNGSHSGPLANLYIDGKAIGPASNVIAGGWGGPTPPPPAAPFVIGDAITMKIDELAIFTRELSAGEVGSIHEVQSSRQAGIFVSRNFNSNASGNQWQQLSMQTNGSWGAQLPEVSETFGVHPVDFNNVLVFMAHLNEIPGRANNIADSSPSGLAGSTSIAGSLGNPGKFGSAWRWAGAGSEMVFPDPAGNTGFLPHDEFTVCAWVIPTSEPSTGLRITNKAGATPDTGWYFETTTVSDGNADGFNDVTIRLKFKDSTPNYYYRESVNPVPADQRWVHVCAVQLFTGTINPDNIFLFINGNPVAGNSVSAGTLDDIGPSIIDRVNTLGEHPLIIGQFQGSPSGFQGALDEVAIFHAGLDSMQIGKMYLRGVARMSMQVRSCPAACTTQPWVGINGSPDTTFNSANGMVGPGDALPGGIGSAVKNEWSFGGSKFSGQFFQYRAIFTLNRDLDLSTVPVRIEAVAAGPATFGSNNSRVLTAAGPVYKALHGLHFNFGPAHNGAVNAQLSPNGTDWYYWNGTANAWQKSATISSPVYDVDINASKYGAQFPGKPLYVRLSVPQAGGGGVPMIEIDSIEMVYTP